MMMTLQKHKMEDKSKIRLRDLNTVITCALCKGYLIDATSLVDCLHVFCRVCILKHFEDNKTSCPSPHCNIVYKKKSLLCIRSDPQIQSLVYKIVPGLYSKEMQRRDDFYRSTGVRAGSSCSDDSVLERERDMINDQEEVISNCIGKKSQFFSPDELISLSLEYYQVHLDTTSDEAKKEVKNSSTSTKTINNNTSDQQTITSGKKSDDSAKSNLQTDSSAVPSECVHKNNGFKVTSDSENCDIIDSDCNKDSDKRFLQCPAAVSMKHLQKFLRMKFGLTADHKVDIIYKGEVLPLDFSLMDVAYSFKWEKTKPMRFFYRIFTPMKIRPIKIVNTTLSTGGKQLQIVPVKPNADTTTKTMEKKQETPTREEEPQETEDQKHHKERLFAHLKLQSKSKVQNPNNKKVPDKMEDCVFDYVEPDQEEIKRFAEKRDREWAMQKKLDDNKTDYASHHFTKKRKKSKHSKNESVHKKRKLHAEITSNEEVDLKLKVKITPHNGHKHKHHKSSSQQASNDKTSELSSTEKLQIRQFRHKHPLGDEKVVAPPKVPSITLTKDVDKAEIKQKSVAEKTNIVVNVARQVENHKKVDAPKVQVAPESVKPAEIKTKVVAEKLVEKPSKTEATVAKTTTVKVTPQPSSSKISMPTIKNGNDLSLNAKLNQVWGKKIPHVQLERHEQTEKQAQKTFLKTFQPYTDKHSKKIEKIQPNKVESQKIAKTQTVANNINTNNKVLDRKIASLQQHCTIEAKSPTLGANPKVPTISKPLAINPNKILSGNLKTPTNNVVKPEKVEKKVSFTLEKPTILNSQYPPGFTVSKIETGIKRKLDETEKMQDKRPSLEITLINPPTTSPTILNHTKPLEVKAPAKRPPPATIPLERIKKSVNLKSGISIIPKMPERCDNIGALDLSNKSPEVSPKTEAAVNGFNLASRQLNNKTGAPSKPAGVPTTEKNNMQLSNLQMLSKVATEHPNLNKTLSPNNVNKVRQQIPNLQTIKIPSISGVGLKTPNLQKIPNLNEIKKYRPQMRNLYPNKSIRDIPNPSMLNQNRLNSINKVQNSQENKEAAVAKQPISSTAATQPKETQPVVTAAKPGISLEVKITEKKEISV